MDGGAAEGVAVARDRVEAGLEELFLGFLGELGKGGGRGIGEGAAEAYDGLEGVLLVDDDRGDVLVGLVQRLEGLGAVIGQQLVMAGPFVGHVGRGGRCGGRNKDAGLLIFPFLGQRDWRGGRRGWQLARGAGPSARQLDLMRSWQRTPVCECVQ